MTTNSESNTQMKEDIINSLENEQQTLDEFINSIRNKDITIFMGNTRSGKSTLVKYILKADLEAVESEVRMDFKIQEKNSAEESIRHGSLSSTGFPKMYAIENEVLIDLPGFEDNRGIVKEITNALGISQIKVARTVKFVIVFDINDIVSDSISKFTTCLEQVQMLVRNYENILNAFSFVFTKDFRGFDQNSMTNLLYQKVINVPNLNVDKTLIIALAQNPNRIGIFKMPLRVGDISHELDLNINGAIAACQKVEIDTCNIKFSLSDRAQETLLQIFSEYTDTNYFNGEVDKIINQHRRYFDIDRYVFASFDEELRTTKSGLENIVTHMTSAQNETRIYLIDIRSSLTILLDGLLSRQFIDDFQFICVLNQASLLEDKYSTIILQNYKNSLINLIAKVNAVIGKINQEQTDRKNANYKYIGAGVAGGITAVPAGIAIGRAVDPMIKTGNILKNVTAPCTRAFVACEEVIGTAWTTGLGVGAVIVASAAAGGSYVLYKETTGKRNACRRQQNR